MKGEPVTEFPEKPWYRHFWVWFILAPLIATVIASMITLFLAGSGPELVNDAEQSAQSRPGPGG